jgi:alpha-L-fucosidase
MRSAKGTSSASGQIRKTGGHESPFLRVLTTRVVFCLLLFAAVAFGQASEDDRIQWFKHDKFGMFIHWGPYSYLAGEWKGQQIPVGTEAEWIMQRFNIPVAEYRQMAHNLNPVHFDAKAWVALAKATGMKYLVVTAKHHDGFAMYNSKVSSYNIVDWTPFKRDPVKELSEECKKAGIRFCVYYSHREDWDDPDGFGNTWDYPRDQKNFERYLQSKSLPQLRELLTNYGPLGLVWFDRGMDTPEHARLFVDLVRKLQPPCLINGRVGSYGEDLMGDYQDMNDNGMPSGGLQEYWETPQTLNTTWGFSKFDQQWKTPGEVIHRMVEIVSKGGNYLLNIGPMADGTLPAASVATLQGVGEWMHKNSESIYGTTASPLADPTWGRVTVKGGLLYLHVFTWPADHTLRLSGLLTKAVSAHPLLAPGSRLHVNNSFGTLLVSLPDQRIDPNDTVVVVQLAAPPQAAPVVLTQGTNSPVNLDYASAITAGHAVKRFNRLGGFHIAKWTGPKDSITWQVLVSQAGEYHIRISYSAKPEARGDGYRIQVGDQVVTAAVEATGEAYQYKTFELKSIPLKARRYTVRITPVSEHNHNLMYLSSVDLVPYGPIMVD